jgi:hypothetical protein
MIHRYKLLLTDTEENPELTRARVEIALGSIRKKMDRFGIKQAVAAAGYYLRPRYEWLSDGLTCIIELDTNLPVAESAFDSKMALLHEQGPMKLSRERYDGTEEVIKYG